MSNLNPTSQERLNELLEASPSNDRITPDAIKAKIASVQYHNPPHESTTTYCTIIMKTGFEFVGRSACVDPANFNKEIGEKVAYDDAFRQIWSHEGYLLKEIISARKAA